MNYSNNFPENETKTMAKLWNINIDRILKVMLSDGKWYTVNNGDGNNWFELSGYIGNKPYYFSLVYYLRHPLDQHPPHH